MKNILVFSLVVVLLLVSVVTVFAGAKNGILTEWSWRGEKSGYWQTTGSEIVQMWSYDRPEGPDMHYVYKPLDLFPDASCEDGATSINATWQPINLYNVTHSMYKSTFMTIFPDLFRVYYQCGSPIVD